MRILKNYRYDVIGADIKCHIHEHPQKQMKNLGFTVIKAEPVPMADCWWFRVEDDIADINTMQKESGSFGDMMKAVTDKLKEKKS